jgi:hypothetical protein
MEDGEAVVTTFVVVSADAARCNSAASCALPPPTDPELPASISALSTRFRMRLVRLAWSRRPWRVMGASWCMPCWLWINRYSIATHAVPPMRIIANFVPSAIGEGACGSLVPMRVEEG